MNVSSEKNGCDSENGGTNPFELILYSRSQSCAFQLKSLNFISTWVLHRDVFTSVSNGFDYRNNGNFI